MEILVFGAGAMGSLIGGCLARKHAVTLVARRDHVEAVRSRGLRVRGRTELTAHPRAVDDVEDVEAAPDLVILTVKSYDTAAAVEALRPFWDRALFLSLQNGLGNLETVAARAARVLGGITYNGVTFVAPGEVDHAGEGDTVLGPFHGTGEEDAREVAAELEACGLSASVVDPIGPTLWTKAVVNACFNPLTGLLRATSGALDTSPWLQEASALVVAEAVAVAATRGVTLDEVALLERVGEVARATARNRSSMLQDLERGRRTEIDAINGAIARMGEEAGVPCPVNRVLTLLVKEAEGQRSSHSR